MLDHIKTLNRLTEQLSRLPGIGRKTAQRLAFHIVSTDADDVRELADAMTEARAAITECSVCGGLTDTDPCPICTDPRRDRGVICVVRDTRDLAAMERTGSYHGLYHVLGGSLSPMRNIGPGDLRIAELLSRIDDTTEEIILANSADMEGEATASYIAKLLADKNVKVTRIAYGVPVGGDFEYTDEVTLTRALQGRRSAI